MRRHFRFFIAATAFAFLLRLVFLWKFRFIAGDSFVYGDVAKNWLQHGAYAMTEGGVLVPTDIRLPGYPGFIALIWKIAGIEHYTAIMLVQMFVDVGTCYSIAALARLVLSERAALAAFLLYAVNPFTSNYVATPLTEVPAIFFTALVLLFAAKAFTILYAPEKRSSRYWIVCGLAIAAGILLRPDGGILLAAIGIYLLLKMLWGPHRGRIVSAGVFLTVVSLAPLVPWTLRNWRVLHVFQPLAPRYANSPSEFVPMGFNRWVKTWLVDYVSVDDIYWHIPDDPVEIAKLPPRAFDSPEQRITTEQLFAAYNATCNPMCRISPELDSHFAELARQRINNSPVRYYLSLPLARFADVWVRPRTEALPLDSHWWQFRRDRRDSVIGMILGAINLAYIVGALIGLIRTRVRYVDLFVLWIVLRSAFLAILENPEPRYTLECWPVVCVFAAANRRPPSARKPAQAE